MQTGNVLTAKLSFLPRVSLISKGHIGRMETKIINLMMKTKRSKREKLREESLIKRLPRKELFS